MNFIISVLIIKLISLKHVYGSACVTVDGPSKDKSCVFPFRYNKIVYNECKIGGEMTNNKVISRYSINPTTR